MALTVCGPRWMAFHTEAHGSAEANTGLDNWVIHAGTCKDKKSTFFYSFMFSFSLQGNDFMHKCEALTSAVMERLPSGPFMNKIISSRFRLFCFHLPVWSFYLVYFLFTMPLQNYKYSSLFLEKKKRYNEAISSQNILHKLKWKVVVNTFRYNIPINVLAHVHKSILSVRKQVCIPQGKILDAPKRSNWQ